MTNRFNESDDAYQTRITGAKPEGKPLIEILRYDTDPIGEIATAIAELELVLLQNTGAACIEGVLVTPDVYAWIAGHLTAEANADAPLDNAVRVLTLARVPIYTLQQLEERGIRKGYEEALKTLTSTRPLTSTRHPPAATPTPEPDTPPVPESAIQRAIKWMGVK